METTHEESLVGRENPYVCKKCGGIFNTIHVDDGVTPFMLKCRATSGCDGMAYSSFYPRGPRPDHIPAPAWEWYMPSPEDRSALKDWEREHIDQGGVLLRERSKVWQCRGCGMTVFGGPVTLLCLRCTPGSAEAP